MALPLVERPGVYDITLRQGTTWRKVLTWKNANGDPVDLTGCTAALHVRVTEFSKKIVLELTSEGDEIVLADDDGRITLQLTATTTGAVKALGYVYDLDVYDGDTKVTLLTGQFNVTKEITHE